VRVVSTPVPSPAGAPAERVGVGDIFATAFTRYGGGFATYGAIALVAVAFPVAGLLVAELAGASQTTHVVVGALLGAMAYLAFVGVVTATIGGRLRGQARPVLGTAALAAPPVAVLIVVLAAGALLVLPFVLPLFALAPVAAGAGDAVGVAACQRSFALVARGGYLRSLGVMAGLLLIGLMLWLGFSIALSPIEGDLRTLLVVAGWAAVYWPLSALVFRNLYGALSGRLVVRR
jgi:hypothetical protein